MKRYFKNLLIAIDQLINAIFGGYCDETISAMAYRNYIHGRWWGVVLKKTIDLIFCPVEKEHCLQSYVKKYGHNCQRSTEDADSTKTKRPRTCGRRREI